MSHTVILSGGLDSTTALALARESAPGEDVAAVSFNYGQRHARELAAAAAVTAHYRIRHQVIDLSGLLHGSALLGETDVPEGHYAADTMTATVVNGRNLLFAAAAIATTKPGDTVWTGVHAGDHPIYPDCRPEFWVALATAAEAYDVRVTAPFITLPKSEVVYIGDKVDAPLELTWSCYQGGDLHCGRCGTCVERAEAFDAAGVTDPTTYADPDYWRTVSAANPA